MDKLKYSKKVILKYWYIPFSIGLLVLFYFIVIKGGGKKCPKNCNDPNGVCNTKTGLCNCKKTYRGSDCSVRCPGDNYNCNDPNGVCNKSGNCVCNEGWYGKTCEIDCVAKTSVYIPELNECSYRLDENRDLNIIVDNDNYLSVHGHSVLISNTPTVWTPILRGTKMVLSTKVGSTTLFLALRQDIDNLRMVGLNDISSRNIFEWLVTSDSYLLGSDDGKNSYAIMKNSSTDLYAMNTTQFNDPKNVKNILKVTLKYVK